MEFFRVFCDPEKANGNVFLQTEQANARKVIDSTEDLFGGVAEQKGEGEKQGASSLETITGDNRTAPVSEAVRGESNASLSSSEGWASTVARSLGWGPQSQPALSDAGGTENGTPISFAPSWMTESAVR
jgi:hypothetical protein